MGRVIPQGTHLIFEADNPYNQVILPMGLADLVLLCSGQFSVREIVEKIYKKQRAVPFRSILMAIHVLHQGGFFENGEDLVLSSNLQSWMEPRRSRWHLSWRFGQRIEAAAKAPGIYYVITLSLLVLSLFGLQLFPSSPLKLIEAWIDQNSVLGMVGSLLLASSILLTFKYLVRGCQLLLLAGKAYNVSLRLSIWGIHLHVGNEATDLFENRLYTIMFYFSQLLFPWMFAGLASYFVDSQMLQPFLIVGLALTFWELNPFVRSDGLNLIRSLIFIEDRDVASWHFESNQLIDSINSSQQQRDADFNRVCAIWGGCWLMIAFSILHESAIIFGPRALVQAMQLNADSIGPVAGFICWLGALYLWVQTCLETVVAALVRPYWRRLISYVSKYLYRTKEIWTAEQVAKKLENLPLFSHFSEEYIRKVISGAKVITCVPGVSLINEKDPSREIFVLLEGKLEIIRSGTAGTEWVNELTAVSIFGETALVDEQPRTMRVVTCSRSSILRVPISVLKQVAEESQTIRHLEDFRNAILVNQFFASSPVFRSLSTSSIDFLSNRGTLEYFSQGQKIFSQGDSGDGLYLILRGTVEVIVHGTSIKQLSQGNFFGEISLIANIPRTATIVATEPSVFFKISADSFWEVLVQHMDLGVFLETISENRLREDLEFTPLPKTGSGS